MPPAMIVNPTTPRKQKKVNWYCMSCFKDMGEDSSMFCSDFCRKTYYTDTSTPYIDDDPADGDWEEDDDTEELRVVWRPVRVTQSGEWHVSTMRRTEEGERRAE